MSEKKLPTRWINKGLCLMPEENKIVEAVSKKMGLAPNQVIRQAIRSFGEYMGVKVSNEHVTD